MPTPTIKLQSPFIHKLLMPNLSQKLVISYLRKLETGTLTLVDQGEKRVFHGTHPAPPGQQLDATLIVESPRFYTRLLSGGSIGMGEAFAAGDWSTPDLIAVIRLMARNMALVNHAEGYLARLAKPFLKWFHFSNENTHQGSRRNILAHYDLGNDFFKLFLDTNLMYSSAIFEHPDSTLDAAAKYKLDVICRKLKLNPQDHVLEIGTGWGGFALHAAKYYGCKVTTTTISDAQFKLASERVQAAGLENQITLLKQDYRALTGNFDKLVSIEMIEAVGWKYYDTFFQACARLLKPEGVMLLQAITIPEQRYEQARKSVDFIQRYIFPGSCIPSIQALLKAATNASELRMVHQEDFARHYAKTLQAWLNRFNEHSAHMDQMGYDIRFKRLWTFYLCYCAGGFFERAIGVSHLIFSKPHHANEPLFI